MTKAFLLMVMLWISQNSGLPLASTPKVELIPQLDLCEKATSRPVCFHVGYYNEGVIYLVNTVSMDDIFDHSFLVHEVVHHMQIESGKEYQCIGKMEKEAYDIQFEFLRQNKIKSPIDESGVGGIAYVLLTQCLRR